MPFRHTTPSTATPNRRGRDAERGETLIEVLVMIVLMGIGFTAIFSGLMTVSRINDANARRTKASIAVQAWAEGLQQPATKLSGNNTGTGGVYTYIDCATPATYGATGQPSGMLPPTWNALSMNKEPVSVEYFDGTFTASGEPNFFTPVGTCYSAGDKGMQRITVKVETPPGDKPRVVDMLTFIKRNQKCPSLKNAPPFDTTRFDNADLGPC